MKPAPNLDDSNILLQHTGCAPKPRQAMQRGDGVDLVEAAPVLVQMESTSCTSAAAKSSPFSRARAAKPSLCPAPLLKGRGSPTAGAL
eukprot:CAMPEP_0204072414 /NCGR_PEP_ID=MMETSP0360-20130528/161656_1 /ASSEMBLY_ACC=CAM_ASM_000342 /TAXON_ID=268821 /ORGANISM="Scrippsiella Hangoei, Strain SHTV-5" /LENGTH=87 /DNA_ID=CAMNT_0051020743 /DNA_START=72 /DNA_END=333 /DNA_ORIENTATION=-